jgi:hypothetical protein
VQGFAAEGHRADLAYRSPTCDHVALDMSTSGYPEAPPASDVAFDVERFEWTAVDRLEVRGRWTGVRGRRFMRPSLNIGVERGRRRLIALLDHKPWAAGDGDTWVAAFPWDGERGDIGPAVLEVGAGLSVELPAPREPRHVREAAARLATAPPPEPAPPAEPARTSEDAHEEELWRARAAADAARRDAEAARGQLAVQRERAEARLRDAEAARTVAERERDRLRQEVTTVRERLEGEIEAERQESARLRVELDARAEQIEQRDRALGEREAALAGREAVTEERDTARRERDKAQEELGAAVELRDQALGERGSLVAERERAVRERRAAIAERDALRRERDAAIAARDSAVAERDRVARVRQGAPRPAAGAVEPAVKVLGPVRDERDAAQAPDEPEPTETHPEPAPVQVPLIEDAAVASSNPVPWDPGGAERKPLLTRAEPLGSRGATWLLRGAALLVLLLVVIAVVLLLAGGGF